METLIIGSHVSFNKATQLLGSVELAHGFGANTFMIYTGAPQNTARTPIDDKLTLAGYDKMLEYGINPVHLIVHAPYIINLGNNEKRSNYLFAIDFLRQEIERCESLGILRLVLHPGSFVNLTREQGIQNIIDGLNEVLTKEQAVFICLETMAGKGSEIGINFDEIRKIMDGVTYSDKLLVCLDTCHLNDAGYDIHAFDAVLEEFERTIGISRIGCVHINDSKNDLGAHKDRHENFGHGTIGFETLLKIIYHPKLKDVPKILETPYVSDIDSKEKSYPPYKFEIEMIRKKENNPSLLGDIRKFYKKD